MTNGNTQNDAPHLESINTRSDRRRWQRVVISLPLNFLDEKGREAEGRTLNICGGGMMFQTDSPPFHGERLVCYIEGLGRMSGHVLRSTSGVVALYSDAPFVKRDRIVDSLTWLVNRDSLELTEERRAPRTTGTGPVEVTTSNGRIVKCHVLDMSFVGAALATSDKRPTLGDMIQVGAQRGQVSRYLPEGFAVDFTYR